jgi:hypothetical protein
MYITGFLAITPLSVKGPGLPMGLATLKLFMFLFFFLVLLYNDDWCRLDEMNAGCVVYCVMY